jgi:hypothetical protein
MCQHRDPFLQERGSYFLRRKFILLGTGTEHQGHHSGSNHPMRLFHGIGLSGLVGFFGEIAWHF